MSAKTDTEAKNMYDEALEVREVLPAQWAATSPQGPACWEGPQNGQGVTGEASPATLHTDTSPDSGDICVFLPRARNPGLRQVSAFVRGLIGSDSLI